jgi:hypothetical protein
MGGGADGPIDARERKLQYAPMSRREARRVEVAQQARAFERQLGTNPQVSPINHVGDDLSYTRGLTRVRYCA